MRHRKPINGSSRVSKKQLGLAYRPTVWDDNHIHIAANAAHHHARRFARHRRLPRADQEDLAQDILLAIIEASPHFDPARGAWSTFVAMLARRVIVDHARRSAAPECVSLSTAEGQRLAALAASAENQRIAVEFGIAVDALPDEPRALLSSIIRHTDLTAARDSSDASPATFYRQLGDLRCWLRVVGVAPPSSGLTAEPLRRTREKESVPNP
jgi:RNA polymerase sigma-70 factor (ECF subfamily)